MWSFKFEWIIAWFVWFLALECLVGCDGIAAHKIDSDLHSLVIIGTKAAAQHSKESVSESISLREKNAAALFLWKMIFSIETSLESVLQQEKNRKPVYNEYRREETEKLSGSIMCFDPGIFVTCMRHFRAWQVPQGVCTVVLHGIDESLSSKVYDQGISLFLESLCFSVIDRGYPLLFQTSKARIDSSCSTALGQAKFQGEGQEDAVNAAGFHEFVGTTFWKFAGYYLRTTQDFNEIMVLEFENCRKHVCDEYGVEESRKWIVSIRCYDPGIIVTLIGSFNSDFSVELVRTNESCCSIKGSGSIDAKTRAKSLENGRYQSADQKVVKCAIFTAQEVQIEKRVAEFSNELRALMNNKKMQTIFQLVHPKSDEELMLGVWQLRSWMREQFRILRQLSEMRNNLENGQQTEKENLLLVLNLQKYYLCVIDGTFWSTRVGGLEKKKSAEEWNSFYLLRELEREIGVHNHIGNSSSEYVAAVEWGSMVNGSEREIINDYKGEILFEPSHGHFSSKLCYLTRISRLQGCCEITEKFGSLKELTCFIFTKNIPKAWDKLVTSFQGGTTFLKFVEYSSSNWEEAIRQQRKGTHFQNSSVAVCLVLQLEGKLNVKGGWNVTYTRRSRGIMVFYSTNQSTVYIKG